MKNQVSNYKLLNKDPAPYQLINMEANLLNHPRKMYSEKKATVMIMDTQHFTPLQETYLL